MIRDKIVKPSRDAVTHPGFCFLGFPMRKPPASLSRWESCVFLDSAPAFMYNKIKEGDSDGDISTSIRHVPI